jgi:hypothetical protein
MAADVRFFVPFSCLRSIIIPCLEILLSKAVAPPSVLLLNMSNDPTTTRTTTTRTTKWILEPR